MGNAGIVARRCRRFLFRVRLPDAVLVFRQAKKPLGGNFDE
jgi:hypothetical protein